MGKPQTKEENSIELEDLEIDLSSGIEENQLSSDDLELDLFEGDSASASAQEGEEEDEDLSDYQTEIESIGGKSKKGDEDLDMILASDLESVGSSDDISIDGSDDEKDPLDLNEDDDDNDNVTPPPPTGTAFKPSAFDELNIEPDESTVFVDPAMLATGNSVNAKPKVYWEELVTLKDAPEGSVAKLLKQGFDSDIEKHVALQSVAMLNGEYSALNDWKHCVWRDAASRTYPHDGRKRLPKGISDPILKTDLRSLIVNLSPLFAQVYLNNFTLDGLAVRQKTTLQKLKAKVQPLAWNSPVLAGFGFLRYAHRFDERRYRAYNLPGLGGEIFFEGKTRSFYFDVAHFQKKPLGMLFYGVLTKVWALRLGYFGFLSLDISKEVLPCMEKFKESFTPKTAFSTFGFSKDIYKKFFESSLGDKVRLFEPTLFGYKSEQLFSLHNAMNDHIYKLLLADSLDLIGLLEYITGDNIVENGAEADYASLQKKSIYTKSLYKVFTTLKLKPDDS